MLSLILIGLVRRTNELRVFGLENPLMSVKIDGNLGIKKAPRHDEGIIIVKLMTKVFSSYSICCLSLVSKLVDGCIYVYSLSIPFNSSLFSQFVDLKRRLFKFKKSSIYV